MNLHLHCTAACGVGPLGKPRGLLFYGVTSLVQGWADNTLDTGTWVVITLAMVSKLVCFASSLSGWLFISDGTTFGEGCPVRVGGERIR
jgi:hypothetical protein